MMAAGDLEIDMRDGRDRLEELRREVGWPTDDEVDGWERVTDELREAYIQALESAVVGGTAAMKGIARSLRGSTLFSRTEPEERT